MQLIYLLLLPLTLRRFGDLFTIDTRRLAEKLGLRIGAHYAAMARGPKTIVHGDCRIGNVLFGGEDEIGLCGDRLAGRWSRLWNVRHCILSVVQRYRRGSTSHRAGCNR